MLRCKTLQVQTCHSLRYKFKIQRCKNEHCTVQTLLCNSESIRWRNIAICFFWVLSTILEGEDFWALWSWIAECITIEKAGVFWRIIFHWLKSGAPYSSNNSKDSGRREGPGQQMQLRGPTVQFSKKVRNFLNSHNIVQCPIVCEATATLLFFNKMFYH